MRNTNRRSFSLERNLETRGEGWCDTHQPSPLAKLRPSGRPLLALFAVRHGITQLRDVLLKLPRPPFVLIPLLAKFFFGRIWRRLGLWKVVDDESPSSFMKLVDLVVFAVEIRLAKVG